MATDILWLLSPTYRKKIKRTAKRKRMVVSCLKDNGEFREGGANAIIEDLRQKGYTEKLNRHIIYTDREPFWWTCRFLNGDEKVRQAVAAYRKDQKSEDSGALLGILCLLKDHQEAETWKLADVERALDKLQEEIVPPPQELPVHEPEIMEEQALAEAFPSPEASDRSFQGLVDFVQRFVERVGPHFRALHEEVEQLKRTNASLNKRLGEQSKAVDNAHIVAKTIKDTLSTFEVEGCGLPTKTTVSPGGWEREFNIIYRDAFKERFFGGYLQNPDKVRVIETLTEFAHKRRFWKGHKPKTFTRWLPGIPEEVRRYKYSPATERFRITWKVIEGALHVLNIHDHSEIE